MLPLTGIPKLKQTKRSALRSPFVEINSKLTCSRIKGVVVLWLPRMGELTINSFKTPTGHTMSYVEWDNAEVKDEPTLILCVHGLTRNGR